MKTLLLFNITLLLLSTGCEVETVKNEPISSENTTEISSSDSDKATVNADNQSSSQTTQSSGSSEQISSSGKDDQSEIQSSSSDPLAEPTEYLDNEFNHPRQQTIRLLAELDFVSASELEGKLFELDTLFLEYDYKLLAGSTLLQERLVVTRIQSDKQFEFDGGTLIHHTIGNATDDYTYSIDSDELVLESGFGHGEANGVFDESDLRYKVGVDGDRYYLILAEELTESAVGKAAADTRTLFKWNFVMRKIENTTTVESSVEEVTMSSSSDLSSSSSIKSGDGGEENPNSGCYQCPTGVICMSGIENVIGMESCSLIP